MDYSDKSPHPCEAEYLTILTVSSVVSGSAVTYVPVDCINAHAAVGARITCAFIELHLASRTRPPGSTLTHEHVDLINAEGTVAARVAGALVDV